MEQAPQWLPFRVRGKIDQWRILRAVRGIEKTPPMPAASPDDAAAEAQMLLCKRDLKIGVLAFKSLLRFTDVKFAVTVLNDGSLTPRDTAWFDRHIPNVRWQTWKEEDPRLTKVLDQYPTLAGLYRESNFEQIAKMLHPLFLSRCERVVQFDSDTAFFKRPEKIFDFCNGNDSQPLYLHDDRDEDAEVPAEVEEAFASLKEAILPNETWGLQHRFFNAGFLVYRPDQMKIEKAEGFLNWLASVPEHLKSGRGGVWFGDWTREQSCYHAMFAAADPPPEPMGTDYWLGGAEGKVFNHFLRHYIVRKSVLQRMSGLIDDIAHGKLSS